MFTPTSSSQLACGLLSVRSGTSSWAPCCQPQTARFPSMAFQNCAPRCRAPAAGRVLVIGQLCPSSARAALPSVRMASSALRFPAGTVPGPVLGAVSALSALLLPVCAPGPPSHSARRLLPLPGTDTPGALSKACPRQTCSASLGVSCMGHFTQSTAVCRDVHAAHGSQLKKTREDPDAVAGPWSRSPWRSGAVPHHAPPRQHLCAAQTRRTRLLLNKHGGNRDGGCS